MTSGSRFCTTSELCLRRAGKKGKAAAPSSAGKGGQGGAAAAPKGAKNSKVKGKGIPKGDDKPARKIIVDPMHEIATERAAEIAKESERVVERAKALRVRCTATALLSPPLPPLFQTKCAYLQWFAIILERCFTCLSLLQTLCFCGCRQLARGLPEIKATTSSCPCLSPLQVRFPHSLISPAWCVALFFRLHWEERSHMITLFAQGPRAERPSSPPLSDAAESSHPAVVSAMSDGGLDIVKRSKNRTNRYLFVLPGQIAPLHAAGGGGAGGSGTTAAAAAAVAAGADKAEDETPSRQIVRPAVPTFDTAAFCSCMSLFARHHCAQLTQHVQSPLHTAPLPPDQPL